MNLWSFSDFMKDAGKTLNEIADAGKQVVDVLNQVNEVASPIWQKIDPKSHEQFSGAIGQGLDLSSDIFKNADIAGNSLSQGQMPSGMYLPNLPFQNLGWGFSGSIPGMGSAGFGHNGMGAQTPFGGFSAHWQQQQLQQLGFFDDLKSFGKEVGNVGQNVVGQAQKVVNPAFNTW